MKEILKVNNLIKKFPKAGGEIDDADAISVLKGINFDVEQGEYVGIMGKSGCGKKNLRISDVERSDLYSRILI